MIEEAATGVRVLKALGRGPEAAEGHLTQATEVYHTQVAKARLLGGFWSVLDLIPNAAIALIVVLGTVAVSHHTLTLGGLVAFITLALQLVWPIEALGYVLASGEEAATAAQRVLEIFDTPPEIKDETHSSERKLVPAQAHLRFEHVAFTYPGSREPVLRDVDLALARGETLVLTGATGSGKTTLLQLVPRLADVTGGRVLLGGTDVRDIPLAALRAAVGCAFEEATLFSASVRENVTFGAADASDEDIEAALIAAKDVWRLDALRWNAETSMLKTLAAKDKSTVAKMAARHRALAATAAALARSAA